MSQAIVAGYCRAFRVDLSDVDPDLLASGFRRFDDFFTRTLREGARPVAQGEELVVSPADGYLREVTAIDDGHEVIAKDHRYKISELLADGESKWSSRFVGGTSIVVYLHPRDYHRVHCPTGGEVVHTAAVPGRLLPVTDASLARNAGLFARNERLVHLLETPRGPVAVVMVAAFGVGHMSTSYADVAVHPEKIVSIDHEPGIARRAGEELGIFHLGSTVVLLLGPGQVSHLRDPGPVRMGEGLVRWGHSK
jgi:phosphatidylserine decarboxylase